MAGKYPGRIGSLLSPGRWKNPVTFAPYALDNGAFKGFNAEKFIGLCEKARFQKPAPIWVVIPDCVGDMAKTNQMYCEWIDRVKSYGWPVAFAVQDGMTPSDVPPCDVVFVGGTFEWKWRNLKTWTANFKRVHVGRVNTERHLWQAQDAGAESCDGTGWFRNIRNELPKLLRFLDGIRIDENQEQFFKGERLAELQF